MVNFILTDLNSQTTNNVSGYELVVLSQIIYESICKSKHQLSMPNSRASQIAASNPADPGRAKIETDTICIVHICTGSKP